MDSQVTVIIPCFNTTPHLLDEALRSVRNSTLQNISVIVINDGSTNPDTLAALNQIEASDSRLRVIHHHENRGLSAARNTGVTHCQTQYFLQLDADDVIEPTFIEKCVWALESHSEWAFCNSWSVGFGAKNYEWRRGFERRTDFLAENQVAAMAVIRRQADRAIGGHDESIRGGLEDWDYWLKMAAHSYWGGTIPEFLVGYRQHAESNVWPNRDQAQKRAEFRQLLRNRYPQLWKRNGFPRPTPPAHRPWRDNCSVHNIVPQPKGRTSILCLFPWLNLGGADRFNLNAVEQLTRRGYGVNVCTTVPSSNPWLAEFSRYTPDIFSLPNFLTPDTQPLFLRYLIESRQIDVVLISNSMLGYSLLPYLRAHCPDTAFVDYNHMVVPQWLDGGFARVGMNSQAQLDLNIVSSVQVKRWMVEQGAQEKRIEVCHTNQDVKDWNPARFNRTALRHDLGIPDDLSVILYPARLEPQKRPRMLVKILRELRDRCPRFVCLIAGDGPQRSWLEGAIRRYRLSAYVRVLGAVPPDKMPELMAVSDILLLPSEAEGISLAIFEAMAMALVVVASDVGGQNELVTQKTGYLVPHGPNEVNEYVTTLVSLLDSRELRQRLGHAARERIVANFTIDQMGEQMVALLAKARLWAVNEPRPRLSTAEAQTVAERVVDDLRHERLQERLRAAEPMLVAGADGRLIGHWRQIVYSVKKRVFRPAYYWALQNGHDWVVPLVGRAYRHLQWLLK
jgi:glycosyltransferase involved in cell wall biosynthesis/GT2 family glycosyltransferase